jgi:Tol biopolymer transport system component/DNA-binding winged helix-turn-helix (wHTH) protein
MLDLVRFEANVVEETVRAPRLVRFGAFEVDLRAGELRKDEAKLKLTGQPFQVLTILLEQPGEVVSREELQKRLWPDTFVDADHNLNTAVNKIREALGDSAECPRFVETLPRRGYRFIAPLDIEGNGGKLAAITIPDIAPERRRRVLRASLLLGALTLLAGAGFLLYKGGHASASPRQRTLTRVTFDDGLQVGATWSPDGRFIAYSSDHGGKLDIWIQQVSGGDAIQITEGSGNKWAPNWSPDGKYIAFRSENGNGGLFIVPALGGTRWERRIASFGYYPRWSPDGSQILFQTTEYAFLNQNRFYVVGVNGEAPHEVPMEFLKKDGVAGLSAAWHPDGRRISVWSCDPSSFGFWTQPIAGGSAVKSEMSAEVLKQMEEASEGRGTAEWRLDFAFSWAPSGEAVYFERTFRGAKNIWRMTLDPQTLRALAFDRLTTGPGDDAELSLSADGKRLAFTSETRRVRAWMFPFDASRGRVLGKGKPVTTSGVGAWEFALSRDGKKLVYRGDRAGKWELWESLLSEGREAPVVADDSYLRNFPQWSRDGVHLAYFRDNLSTGERQLIDWSTLTREERPITPSKITDSLPYDWSPDGKWLLTTVRNASTGRAEIWAVPTTAGIGSETAARKIISHPGYDIYQSHFSPDGRWIVFEATSPTGFESTIYAVSVAGGPWLRITDGKHWDDKPRWSPDGKTIYFVSGRSGFYNVFGVRFDHSKENQDPSFPVTKFDSPRFMIPKQIMAVDLSLTKDRLVVTLAEVSGSIWVLDNVDQ